MAVIGIIGDPVTVVVFSFFMQNEELYGQRICRSDRSGAYCSRSQG